jgi:hypothetical protein
MARRRSGMPSQFGAFVGTSSGTVMTVNPSSK